MSTQPSCAFRLPHRLRVGLPLVLGVVLLFTFPALVWGHPLGNFSVNRYSRLEVAAEQIDLFYVLDMAEIPTFQERAEVIDRDRDERISSAEEAHYLAHKVAALHGNLHLLVDGSPVPLELQSKQLEFVEGQGGLLTLRLTAHLVAQLPATKGTREVHYRDENEPERLGWREIVVQPSPGAELISSSVPSEDLTQELRRYPSDLLQSPLSMKEARFSFKIGLPATTARTNASSLGATTDELTTDQFAALVNQGDLGWGALLLALVAAFGWGAAHALTPGHGKTIVAAYLVGSRGTTRHALFLGLTTTITHTAGVFALGFITLFLSRYILPEQLYPWLGVLSGLLVVGIGFSLFSQRLRAVRQPHTVHDHHHDHAHDHLHEHDHSHDHSHDHPHHHDHPFTHTHDGHTHSHLPPGADGNPVTWRDLLALGVSGGLIPCPSALVVLLSAIALNRVGFGLLLITIFSVGLASVLTGIGILLVHAQKLFDRLPASGPLLRVLPVASALIITLLGLGITVQALAQMGAVQHIIVASAKLF